MALVAAGTSAFAQTPAPPSAFALDRVLDYPFPDNLSIVIGDAKLRPDPATRTSLLPASTSRTCTTGTGRGCAAPNLSAALAGDGLTQADLQAVARVRYQSSPISSVATWKSPVLLIHPDDDGSVEFHQTVDLKQRLHDKGHGFSLIQTAISPWPRLFHA